MPLHQITVSSSPTHNNHQHKEKDPEDLDSSIGHHNPDSRQSHQTHTESVVYTPSPQQTNLANIPAGLTNISAGLMMERCGSQASVISLNHDICRICHCEGDSEVPLIAPCYCSGSLRYVHQACLQQWIKSSDTKSCELCKFHFIMQSKIKPFGEWEKLAMSSVERRKLLCSVTFHAVALTCVVWSLYVLIDRTAEEVRVGLLEWPFWTKLVVVAIGFTGGLVFMYIQCKMYVQLCRRWRAFNRVIFVQNAPEKPPPVPNAPVNASTNNERVSTAVVPVPVLANQNEDEPDEGQVLVPVGSQSNLSDDAAPQV